MYVADFGKSGSIVFLSNFLLLFVFLAHLYMGLHVNYLHCIVIKQGYALVLKSGSYINGF